jgi:protein TonB
MPQEFLRDVVRPGDVKGRQRRLSVLPVSIAIHAIVLTVFLVSPWISEGELPIVGSPVKAFQADAPPPPPPPPAPVSATVARTTAAPTQAPDDIAEEPPARANTDEEAPPGAISFGDGPAVETRTSLLGDLGKTVAPLPPPPVPEPAKPVRVGTGIREPKKLVHVAPTYPELARVSRIEGKVTMEAILDVTGKVESVRVLSSQPLLEDAAVRAVRQWRYSPTLLNGVPVPVLMTITVVFTLAR